MSLSTTDLLLFNPEFFQVLERYARFLESIPACVLKDVVQQMLDDGESLGYNKVALIVLFNRDVCCRYRATADPDFPEDIHSGFVSFHSFYVSYLASIIENMTERPQNWFYNELYFDFGVLDFWVKEKLVKAFSQL